MWLPEGTDDRAIFALKKFSLQLVRAFSTATGKILSKRFSSTDASPELASKSTDSPDSSLRQPVGNSAGKLILVSCQSKRGDAPLVFPAGLLLASSRCTRRGNTTTITSSPNRRAKGMMWSAAVPVTGSGIYSPDENKSGESCRTCKHRQAVHSLTSASGQRLASSRAATETSPSEAATNRSRRSRRHA